MYTFIRAIAVKYGYNQRWEEVDISSIPANILFTKYRQIYAVLTNTVAIDEMTLDLNLLSADLQIYTGTISDYLSANGNNVLPTAPGHPVITRANVIFSDAFEADYNIEQINLEVGAGVELPDEDKPHLVILKADEPEPFDYPQFRRKVMANVNGFYHRTGSDSNGYYILDGNKTSRKAKQNHVGLLSFATMGDLVYLDITDDNLLFDFFDGTDDVERVYLKYDKDAFDGKTPLLILGGYMILVDGETLLNANEGVLTFKTRLYPTFERYFESKNSLDYSDFGIVSNNQPSNLDWVELSIFRKEDYWRKLFKMSQSFVVLVDSQHLVIEKTYPELQTVPHTFMSYEQPKWPLVVCEGKHEVFWSQYEAKSWVLTCGDTYKRKYMFQTTAIGDLVAVDESLVLADAGRYSPGYFLKLIDEAVVIKTT